jgi:hypothetical protein
MSAFKLFRMPFNSFFTSASFFSEVGNLRLLLGRKNESLALFTGLRALELMIFAARWRGRPRVP